ncbi:MAG: isoprenyl transferase [Desulfopila sp.]
MSSEPTIDREHLPRHIAIIMDGNGRWAVGQNRPRLYGHRVGAQSVQAVVETAREIGIEVLTLYAFSSENWNRPEQEVSGLMAILQNYLSAELSRMLANKIRLCCLGDIDRLPRSTREQLQRVMEATRNNNELILNLALSYGARDELTRAARGLAEDCLAGRLQPEDITVAHVQQKLYTADMPDPDLLIRTGGEARLSNFLLWQASYAEIYFTDTMWPEFRRQQFLEAIGSFQRRERRFGKTSAQLADR